MKNKLPIYILIVLIVAALSFYGGMKYQQSKKPSFSFNGGIGSNGGNNFNRNFGNRMGFATTTREQMIIGEIISKDDNTLTLKLPNGNSLMVIYSQETKIEKSEPAQLSDLEIGKTIRVFGKLNAASTISATSIQIR